GPGPGGGLGRAVRGPAAASLQLLPLSGRPRRRGRRPDVAHVREGVGGAEPLPAGPGGVRNVAIDHYRRRREHAPLEAAGLVASGDDPHAQAEQRENLERLLKLLGQLPDRDRELVALKYGADLTNRAIAKQMNLTETNVGTLLHRAVQKLRAGWDEGV